MAWKHLAEGFYQLYKQGVDAWIAKRWQALGILGLGERWKRVKEVGGRPQADSAGGEGVEGGKGEMCGMGPCGFSQGEGGGRGWTEADLSTALFA
jgi:hypothetical protein